MNKKEIISELSARKIPDEDKAHQETNDWCWEIGYNKGLKEAIELLEDN